MARSFNGTSDKILTANAARITSGNKLTIAAWVKNTSWTAGGLRALTLGGGNVAYLGTSGNAVVMARFLVFITTTGNQTFDFGTGLTFTNGVWQHLAATYDGDGDRTMRGYLDGAAASDTKVVTGVNAIGWGAAGKASIGTQDGGGGSFWNGALAEIAVWNVALTPEQIRALAHGVPPWRIGVQPTLWLPLYGAASPEVELSGGGLTGTLTGTAQVDGPPVMPPAGFDTSWLTAAPVSAPPAVVAQRQPQPLLMTLARRYGLKVPLLGRPILGSSIPPSVVTDSGSVAVTLAATGSEQLVEANAAAVTVTPAGAETLLDQGAAQAILTPQAALEAASDAGSGTATFTPAGAETVAESGTAAVTGAPSDSEQIQEANTAQIVFTPAPLAEIVIDQAADTVTLTPTGSGGAIVPGSDAGTATVTFTPAGAEILLEAGSAQAVMTPTGTETLRDQGATSIVLAPAGADAVAETGAATVTSTPTGAGAAADAGTATATSTPTGSEQIRDTGTTTITFQTTAVEVVIDAGTATLTGASTGIGTIVVTSAGTVTVTFTATGTGSSVSTAFGHNTGTYRRGPQAAATIRRAAEAAGETDTIPQVETRVIQG